MAWVWTQHNTTQHNRTQHNAAQHNRTQQNTTQHSTTHTTEELLSWWALLWAATHMQPVISVAAGRGIQ